MCVPDDHVDFPIGMQISNLVKVHPMAIHVKVLVDSINGFRDDWSLQAMDERKRQTSSDDNN